MTDSVLIVGGGGREHAIAYAIRGGMDRNDPLATDVDLYACAENRNPGISRACDGFSTRDPTDPEAVVEYAERVDAELAIIGPEAPLAAGVVDALEEAGIYAFGPTAELAKIETDKAHQREFMRENEIPGCPEYEICESSEDAAAYIEEFDGELAVKPAGLTGGKGVKVIGDQITLEEAVEYVSKSEYDRWVLEERLVGEEFTVQALVADGRLRTTPAVQDHKRAKEGDEGPNTGGMGSYSAPGLTLPFMSEEEYHEAVEILQATVTALEDYRGVLYGQFMLTPDGVKVIEFNARFGDPEAMNTLPVMNTSLLDVLTAAREGDPLPQLSFAPRATVCKYAVPKGYPTGPEDGVKLDIEDVALEDALLFYASVDEREDGIYSTTSRSFAVVGIGATIQEAETRAENALEEIGVDDMHVRHDIGTDRLVESRVTHLEELRADS